MSIIQIDKRLQYNAKLNDRAKEMRKNMTEAEKKLWFLFLRKLEQIPLSSLSLRLPPLMRRGLRGSSENLRILKQRVIDNYIVDFYIPKLRLVIEVDWESHFTEEWKDYDIERTQVLEWLWLKVLRFTNEEIMRNFDWVCERLKEEFSVREV